MQVLLWYFPLCEDCPNRHRRCRTKSTPGNLAPRPRHLKTWHSKPPLKNQLTNNAEPQIEEEWTTVALKQGSWLPATHNHPSTFVVHISTPPSILKNPYSPLSVDDVIPCTIEDFSTLDEASTSPPSEL
jgi:hypothetical protein